MKIELDKYDTKTLWSLIGDIDRLSGSDNKEIWLTIGAGIKREIDKRLKADYDK